MLLQIRNIRMTFLMQQNLVDLLAQKKRFSFPMCHLNESFAPYGVVQVLAIYDK